MTVPAAADPHDLLIPLEPHRRELLVSALSEFIADTTARRLTAPPILVVTARLYVAAPVYANGVSLPPHVDKPPALPAPSGDAALKRLGIDRDELAERWRGDQRRWRAKATLPTEWLIEFVPVPT